MKPASINHLPGYTNGAAVLRKIGWHPTPKEMFKAPSLAKGSPARIACDSAGIATDDALLAARLEHLIAIRGEPARQYLLSDRCALTRDQIAGLCRRMPPFIAAKLKELEIGGTNINGNATGAFDTNGWAEIRVRLPKFRSSMHHYAKQCSGGVPKDELDDEGRAALVTTAEAIITECEVLVKRILTFTPKGAGKPRIAGLIPERVLLWSKAPMKMAQVLGVLKKTNRDSNSPHWKMEWIPTESDHKIVLGDVRVIREAAHCVVKTLSL